MKEQQNCSSNVNILRIQENRADVKIFASGEHAVVSSALANVVQRRVFELFTTMRRCHLYIYHWINYLLFRNKDVKEDLLRKSLTVHTSVMLAIGGYSSSGDRGLSRSSPIGRKKLFRGDMGLSARCIFTSMLDKSCRQETNCISNQHNKFPQVNIF